MDVPTVKLHGETMYVRTEVVSSSRRLHRAEGTGQSVSTGPAANKPSAAVVTQQLGSDGVRSSAVCLSAASTLQMLSSTLLGNGKMTDSSIGPRLSGRRCVAMESESRPGKTCWNCPSAILISRGGVK